MINKIAEAYIKLLLEIGLYDSDYIDAYYGPEEWRLSESDKEKEFPFAKLNDQVLDLLQQIQKFDTSQQTTIEKQRKSVLEKQLISAHAKVQILSGTDYSFDEESKLLYDAVAPTLDASHFDNLIKNINQELPGSDSINKRIDDFKQDFLVTIDKLDPVFKAAVNECARRTKKYLDLPENESVTIEYVTDKVWGGYNWFKGNGHSLIQLNTDRPSYIDRAIDLAAHEGYPGHHAYSTLIERDYYHTRNWLEYSIYPLFSPQSLIFEGTANFGIEIVLPDEERIEFEREILFPLAGLDPDRVEQYYSVMNLKKGLEYAKNEAARNFIDGKFTRDESIQWLIEYNLLTPEDAEKRLGFIEYARSYVINYTLGEDIVRDYINSKVESPGSNDKKWEAFKELLTTPHTPSGLLAKR